MLLYHYASPASGQAGRPRNRDTFLVHSKHIRQVFGRVIVHGSRHGRLSDTDGQVCRDAQPVSTPVRAVTGLRHASAVDSNRVVTIVGREARGAPEGSSAAKRQRPLTLLMLAVWSPSPRP